MMQLFLFCRLKVRVFSPSMVTSFLSVCFLVILASITTANAKECSPDQKGGLGWTEPAGDIVLQVGMPLEIFCILNTPSQHNSSIQNVVFYRNKDLVDSRSVSIINETTSRLYIENMNASNDWYYCKLQSSGPSITMTPYQPTSLEDPPRSYEPFEETICMNTVAVGTKPKDVENFTCISINWEMLNCSWKMPDNFVPTNYTVSYMPPVKRPSRNKKYPCPTDDDVKNQRCTWTANSTPPYRRTWEYLIMHVLGVNQFGVNEQSIPFHHFAHIIPNPPTDLEMVSKTTSSILLKWKIGIFNAFSNPLLYKVQYTWRSAESWKVTIYPSKSLTTANVSVFLNVTELPYPNVVYNFRVSMKSAEAPNEEGWSLPVTNLFRTKACPPYTSPKMDVGSFEIVPNSASSRNVYVYWQPLPELEYNGDGFRYEIVVFENGVRVNLNATRVNHSYAEFTILLDKQYRFEVRSVNKEGPANQSTALQVPEHENIIKHCPTFTKTDYGNGIYELSWEPPPGIANDITNYTIFRCESNKERPYQCNGNIEWEHFLPNDTKHNFTVNNSMSYQFAISVNTVVSSSGMYWALCTVLHGRVGSVKHVHVNERGPYHMYVEWKLECSDKAVIIKGYRINYCAVLSASNITCQEPEQSVIVYGGIHKTSGNVTSLKPYTFYKVSVMILTNDNRTGPRSTEYLARTKDGPPDVTGMRVIVLNMTNTTAEIEWDVPNVTNGVLQYYEVYYNHEMVRADGNVSSMMLKGLKSYYLYNVTVKACTSICSEPMVGFSLRTRVGVPSVVGMPQGRTNGTHAFVSWNLPSTPAGPHPMYEVWMLKDGKKINSTETGETEMTVPTPNCNGEKSQLSYEFKVRAKNVDAGVEMLGDWSPAFLLQCVPSDIPFIWKVLGCIFASLFIAILFTYGGKKGLYKCKKMKAVQVTIPTKFIVQSNYQVDSKDTELYDSRGLPQIKVADEFCTLVEKTI